MSDQPGQIKRTHEQQKGAITRPFLYGIIQNQPYQRQIQSQVSHRPQCRQR